MWHTQVRQFAILHIFEGGLLIGFSSMKAPSAEEVIALMNAATRPDGTLDPSIQHLLVQIKEQHELNQAQFCAQTQVEKDYTQIKLNASAIPEQLPKIKSEQTHSTAICLTPLSGMSEVTVPSSNCAPASATVPTDVACKSTTLEATSMSPTIKRKSISLSKKKEAIQWIMGPGKGIPSRAEKHFRALDWDVSASSFRKWWKNRDKILGDSGGKKRIGGGGRKPFLECSEEKLLVVVIQEKAKKDRVTRKWIAKTAQHMFQRSDSTFKASENWVTKFIRRNDLTLKRSYVTYEPKETNSPHQTSVANAHVSISGNNAVV